MEMKKETTIGFRVLGLGVLLAWARLLPFSILPLKIPA